VIETCPAGWNIWGFGTEVKNCSSFSPDIKTMGQKPMEYCENNPSKPTSYKTFDILLNFHYNREKDK
jgi:hypothetical protein